MGMAAKIVFISPLSSFSPLNISYRGCISYISTSIIFSNMGNTFIVCDNIHIDSNRIYLEDYYMNESSVVYTYVAMR